MNVKEELAAAQARVEAQIAANVAMLEAARDEKWPVDPETAPKPVREVKPITLEDVYEAVVNVRWQLDDLYWRLF